MTSSRSRSTHCVRRDKVCNSWFAPAGVYLSPGDIRFTMGRSTFADRGASAFSRCRLSARRLYVRMQLSIYCLVLVTISHATFGQESEPASAYSRGAGAYFAGRHMDADQQLTSAIEFAPQDPRAHYLRGLNYLALGDTRRAQSDLAEGARLEARTGGSSPLVDRSLASVQGSARRTLERIRRSARESAELEQLRAVASARKAAREQREQRVLRTDYQLPIEALASRLTIDQARTVAIKDRSASANDLTRVAQTGGARSQRAGDPFADDIYNEQTTGTPNNTTKSVTSGLLGIFSRLGSRASNSLSASSGGVPIQPMGIGGGSDPMGASGFEEGGFGDAEFGNNDFPPGEFGMPQTEGDDFDFGGQDSDNPFDFAE